MSQAIEIGKVSHRKHARLHLNIDSHAHCGSGSGHIIAGTIKELAATDAPRICRRCRAALHKLAEANRDREQFLGLGRYNEDRLQAAIAVMHAIDTPANIAARQERELELAEIRAANRRAALALVA